jgi:glycosyltransferase involved in cell wall biosynthesis
MSNKIYDFSIIIPTRDRLETLRNVVDMLRPVHDLAIELIICDNATTDGTSEYCKCLNKEGFDVKWIRSEKRLSMEQNWTKGLQSASGKYLTLIGDDDGLITSALPKIVDLFQQNPDIDCIRSDTASYHWPGVVADQGILNYSPKKFHAIKYKSKKILREVLYCARPYTDLPMLYNGGYVRSSLVKKILSQENGKFFRSRTPDVYSAVLFALNSKYFLYLFAPTAINGCSKASNGVSTFTPIEKRKEGDTATFWDAENTIPYHPEIPLVARYGIVPSGVYFVYEALFWLVDNKRKKKLHNILYYSAYYSTSANYKEEISVWRQQLPLATMPKHKIVFFAIKYSIVRFIYRIPALVYRLRRRLFRTKINASYSEAVNVIYDNWEIK